MSPESADSSVQGLAIAPVSRAAFRRYGEIVGVGREPALVNNGTALRHDIGNVMKSERSKSALLLSVFEAEEQQLPLRVTMLECHPLSAQTIVPMQETRFVVIVCPPTSDNLPDTVGLEAFLFGPEQGVNIHPGVWHHPIVALDKKTLFFVQSWQDGSDLDCRIAYIEPVLLVAGQGMP